MRLSQVQALHISPSFVLMMSLYRQVHPSGEHALILTLLVIYVQLIMFSALRLFHPPSYSLVSFPAQQPLPSVK